MGVTDGGLSALFAGAFSAVYLDGTLYRPNAYADDGQGGGSGSGFQPGEAIKVQLDTATQAMRLSEGYVDGDVRILVLASGVAMITTDCEIAAGGTRWMIESVAVDPAGTYYELRGRRKADA